MKFSRNILSGFLLSGDEGIRTPDPLLARQVLSQLSYTPVTLCNRFSCYRPALIRSGLKVDLSPCPIRSTRRRLTFTVVGLSGLEPPTSRLSGVRSNRLSYKPSAFFILFFNLAATYSPTPSPVQYRRPLKS